MLFYALFAVAIWRPLIGIMAMLAWICGSAVLGASGINLGYAFEFINILFGIGMIAGLVLRRGAVPMPALIGAIGIILFAATGFDDAAVNAWPRPAQIIGYGVGSALALVGIIEMERRGWLSFPRLALVIGAASYSIYLTHILVLALVTRLLRIFGLTLLVPGPLAFIALLVIAVAAGVAVHLTAERRIIEFVRRRLAQSVPMRASRQRIQPGA